MARPPLPCIVAFSAILLAGRPAAAIPPEACRPPQTVSGLHALDPYLAARMGALEAASPRFGAAVAALRRSPVPIYLGSPERLRESGLAPEFVGGPMRPLLGEMRALSDPCTGELRALVVRVDVRRLSGHVRRPLLDWGIFGGGGRFRARLDRVVDEVLIHEVWGHLVPVAEAGSVAGLCPDPAPGQPAPDACVMRRENDMRTELGWRPRRRYALF